MILDRMFHAVCTSPLALRSCWHVTTNRVTSELTPAPQAALPRHLKHTPDPPSPQAKNGAKTYSKRLPHFEEAPIGVEVLRESVGSGTVPVLFAVAGYGDGAALICPEYGAIR